ncbi:hypothetical protein ACH42_09280 [Endozoicomonas sp. (ex Bugula neritina AB1)]|nr:hypothetical protein ACH42_09280 [Endozoicomonas sp. (ex Bugula neritina AB1)]
METTHDETALWQQRVAAWRESGLKQSVWCRQNGVKDSRFWYWKKKLSLLAEKGAQPKREDSKSIAIEPSAFVPVAMTPTVPALEAPEGLSVELPNGLRISGVLSSNVTLTKTLIEALMKTIGEQECVLHAKISEKDHIIDQKSLVIAEQKKTHCPS